MSMLKFDEASFKETFPHVPFLIQHTLVDHPLLQLPRLLELAKQHPAELVEYNAGNIGIEQDPSKTPRNGLSIEETVRRIAENKSWLVLKHVERDPEYGKLLNDALDELTPVAESLLPETFQREGFIFVTSPNSVTPYHIDHEHNFLLQIRGEKTMHVFDGSDRNILSEQQIENFYNGAHRNLPFNDEIKARGTPYLLTPGVGLHVPVNFPHWVQNGGEVSVSFSITFRSRFSERRMRIYHLNAKLRKWGMSPTPFGKNQSIDAAKYFTARVLGRMRKLTGEKKSDQNPAM